MCGAKEQSLHQPVFGHVSSTRTCIHLIKSPKTTRGKRGTTGLALQAALPPKTNGRRVDRRFRLGRKKVFDAEVFAIHHAMRTFDERSEASARFTIFTDSTTAMRRAVTDRLGPGQAPWGTIITTGERFRERGCSITIRWTPAHRGVEGNEIADELAVAAGESAMYSTHSTASN